MREANRKIENTIREIREAQAEKEKTQSLRQDLDAFKAQIAEIDALNDEKIAKKMQQILARKERKEKRKQEKQKTAEKQPKKEETKPKIKVGDTVRIKGMQSVGTVESITGKTATMVAGNIRTKIPLEQLEPAATEKKSKVEQRQENLNAYSISRQTRATIEEHRSRFRNDLDVRGMRGDEALNAVTHYIDDAILVGMSRVRILHGKGDGILRHLIQQYLSTVPNVAHYADEHVQFGGAGITVVDIE